MKNEVDDYIGTFPAETQVLLNQVRAVIKKAAPAADEIISYRMPCYYLNGPLVYFAGFKNHIGFYPTASGIESFKDRFSGYKWSKGAVQFPYNQPVPFDLITEIVRFRLNLNQNKGK